MSNALPAFDEMYRWDRCELVGVDCDSLFIFLAEKQPGCSAVQWARVMERLKRRQGLNPSQVCIDGLSSLELAVKTVWEKARVSHDINHLRRVLDKVQAQFDGMAYQAINKAEVMRKRAEKGPTSHTKQSKLDLLLTTALAQEMQSVTKAEEVSAWIRQAQGALNVVHPETGKVQSLHASQAQLREVAQKLISLGTCATKEASSYLEGLGQEIVIERTEYQTAMKELAKTEQVEFSAIEAAVHLLELSKQRKGAPWPGTKERIFKKMQVAWGKLGQEVGQKATDLLTKV